MAKIIADQGFFGNSKTYLVAGRKPRSESGQQCGRGRRELRVIGGGTFTPRQHGQRCHADAIRQGHSESTWPCRWVHGSLKVPETLERWRGSPQRNEQAHLHETNTDALARKHAYDSLEARITPPSTVQEREDQSLLPDPRMAPSVDLQSQDGFQQAAGKKAKKAAKVPPSAKKKSAEPAVALRRGRQPVNPESDFTSFKNAHKIGSKFEGEVTAFTSHGAVIKVKLRGAKYVECYAPTNLLGTPAPARARDVLKRGDHRTFRLVTVDSERRIAELALA